MKQKLGLCCALIHEPDIMLLDEPTFGVDPISRRDLWLIVHDMVATGITVLVATAYLDEAERCDDPLAGLADTSRVGRSDVIHATVDHVDRDWPRVLRDAAAAGIAIKQEEAAEPTLEDAFIDLVTASGRHAD